MNPNHASTNRRRFIKSVTAAGAVAGIGFPAITRSASPNSKLDVVCIGVGGRGAHNMAQIGKSENIVALCDVNQTNLDAAASQYPKARRFKDFRSLYDTFSNFDAAVVSTTEHTHAFATLPALKMKKAVYCEKPLTRDVHEARMVTQAAKEAGVATQMGTQIHAGDNYRRVVEWIRSKVIGDINEVHVWVSRAWGRQSPELAKANRDLVSTQERPTESMTPPDSLDWDLWLGPAPYRPYHSVYFPGPKWYRWWDFGNGTMSDLGSHWNDLPFWALLLDAPTAVEAGGAEPHPEIAPASMWARYEFPARGDRGPLSMTWYQGAEKPEIWKRNGIPQWNNGVLFVGSNGMLLADYGKLLLLPEQRFADIEYSGPKIPDSIGHHQEWIQAAKTGGKTTCDFQYSGALTESNHLGNVAFRHGQRIEWDSVNLRIPNAPEAERFLRRDYRDGWTLKV